jgi:hypothetical protein
VDRRDGRAVLGGAEGDLRIDPCRHDEAGLAVALPVGAGEAARPPLGVVEAGGGHRHRLPRVPEAGVGGVVPEEPVAAARDEDGHDVHRVELVHVDVAARVVHETVLVSAEAVERLARGRLELGLDVEGRLPHDPGGEE